MSRLTDEQLQQAYDSVRGCESIKRLKAVADAAVAAYVAEMGNPVGEIVAAFDDLTCVSIAEMPPVGTKLYVKPKEPTL